MRAKQFTIEAALGTNPKRPARDGSRPARGHETAPRYNGGISKDKETKFHAKLDNLVHDTFGKRDDEIEENSPNTSRIWAQITQYEQRAKMTKNDIKRDHYLRMADELRGQLPTNEGEVVKFPKKHKGDLENTHDCPKCGGDLQGGKYMGHQVKVCMPCKQVYLPPNSGIDKHGNKVVDEIAGAFPSPSTRAKWAADAAASNAAEAKRQADIKAKADAERLRVNNAIVDKEQRINYHPMPDNEVPVKEVAMRMQGSSQAEKDANARAKAREAEEIAKHQAIVQAYVKIMAAGQPLPPKMQQSYNTMPDFKKEVDAALANIPGQPGRVDLEQRRNYHLLPKNEGIFDSTPKVDWNKRAKELLAKGLSEQQTYQQLVKEGCPAKQAQVYVQAAQMESIGESLAEHGKASRALCTSGRPDSDLGASNLASCKSQGLRARDGEKSHLIGHGSSKVRVTVGGKKIKGKKYGGPLPDYGTRKGQQ